MLLLLLFLLLLFLLLLFLLLLFLLLLLPLCLLLLLLLPLLLLLRLRSACRFICGSAEYVIFPSLKRRCHAFNQSILLTFTEREMGK